MPIRTEETEIGGLTWSVTQFSGTKNLDALHALATTAGPVLAAAFPNAKKLDASALDADVDLAAIAEALVRGLGTADATRKLVFQLLASARVDGQSIKADVFDDVFAGPDIMNLGAVIAFVLKVNFGDFTRAAGGIMSRFAATPAPGKG